MLTEELKVAAPDLDAVERWRVKQAECARRGAELETVRSEREGVRCFSAASSFSVTLTMVSPRASNDGLPSCESTVKVR